MNDHIAHIDQNPVARRQALDAHATESFFLQFAAQLICDRTDVSVRSAGCDDHVIANGRLAFEIDGNDIFGLGVVEAGFYEFEEIC